MLSEEEKKEMLEDGLSIKRRDDFRKANANCFHISFDEYLHILDDFYRMFLRTDNAVKKTITEFNKI